MKYGLTTGLMISSFIFSLCALLFFFGCIFILSGNDKVIWTWIVLSTFFVSSISLIYLIKAKNELNRYIDVGKPVYLAAEHIKEIMKKINICGVEELQAIIEEVMKKELKIIVKNNLKEKENG